VLVTGWFSFLHGEATAGDVLAAEAVQQALETAGIPCDTAWSPVFRPDALHLDATDPTCYSHLVFACGPVHARRPAPGIPSPLLALHLRFAAVRRIAVGVSVEDPGDPAVTGFHRILPRDGPSVERPAVDLAARVPPVDRVPLVGVVLAAEQHEYGERRRHGRTAEALGDWLRGLDAARVPMDTRLDTRDWRLPATPGQLHSLLARLDVVLTTRLHGLVLALRAGVPALAVDPVRGGAKVTAQARALGWPAVLQSELAVPSELGHWWDWCLSEDGLSRARAVRVRLLRAAEAPLLDSLLDELLGELQDDLPYDLRDESV
jgi:Polysaccharide pyruvyl transferase.